MILWESFFEENGGKEREKMGKTEMRGGKYSLCGASKNLVWYAKWQASAVSLRNSLRTSSQKNKKTANQQMWRFGVAGPQGQV